jgi:hypothetical protein
MRLSVSGGILEDNLVALSDVEVAGPEAPEPNAVVASGAEGRIIINHDHGRAIGDGAAMAQCLDAEHQGKPHHQRGGNQSSYQAHTFLRACRLTSGRRKDYAEG